MSTKIAVVIPVYREELTDLEKISLTQCRKVLGRYPLIFVAPEGKNFSYFAAGDAVANFPAEYFRSTQTYSRLLMSPQFYETFSDFDYMLIYQLDAFVFYDALEEFCSLGYDYIGAPWPRISYFSFRDKKDPSKRNKKAVIDSDQTIVFGPGINVINGPSGCGKTTLYKLLKHWDDLDRGSIEYGMVKDGKFTGKPLTSLKAKSELPIGFSFQQLQGFSNFTVEEFWRLGSDKLDKKTIEAWAKKFQISIWADDKKTRYKQMSDLSGGELKRVGLVLSLMQGKPILVIDECTSGLNEVLAKKVLAEINELGKTHTIIFTTHNVDELRRLDVKRLVDIHKHPDGHSEMTLYEVLTKKQKEEYIASVHAQEPKVVEEDEVPIDELIRRSHAGPQEDKKHKNKHLENLGKTLHEGRVFDAYKVIRAIKADDELTWLRAIRERRIKEKIKKNIAASFKPGVRSALKRLTAEEGRRQRSKQKSKR